jgi:hypothetical protein
MADTEAQAAAPAVGSATAAHQGEPCEECGAPLAADQRYCLNCGRRRGGPRVDYRHYMAAGSTVGEETAQAAGADAPQPTSAAEPEKPQRDYAPLAAVGGIAVLGLMLLVGVLIGKGNDGGTTSAPSVIRVPAAAGGEGSESATASKGGGKEGLGLGGSSKKAKGSGKSGGGGTGDAVKASQGDLEELGNTSGEDYVKQSENLPNKIATPGKPPPIDKSTPPGGGEGGGEVIK